MAIRNDNQPTREIVIGLTGGIGVEDKKVIAELKKEFDKIKHIRFKEIRLSKLIKNFDYEIEFHEKGNEPKRIKFLMDKASHLRCTYNKNSLLAILSIFEIYKFRETYKKGKNVNYIVYILNSLKRPEETELLRNIYGRNFLLIGIHTSKEKREHNIRKKIAIKYKRQYKNSDEINNLIKKDFDETDNKYKKHGQNVISTFPDSHYFLNTQGKLHNDVKRIIDILFGYPYHTPNIDERNMFTAKSIALRSSDLSRQVGAVIANEDGDIIATGCNEVPKFGGGFYESNDKNDDREFKKGKDTNVEEKKEILKDLLLKISKIKTKFDDKDINIDDLYSDLDENNAKFVDLLEFGRSVHAELAAICDAAKRGIQIEGSTLYSTTYPCHLCIKHILAVGIKRVVFIYPYPKSKTEDHFGKSIAKNSKKAEEEQKLLLEPFVGISPRRFLHVFRHDKGRKEKNKNIIKTAKRGDDSLYLKNKLPVNYYIREISVLKNALDNFNSSKNQINISKPQINEINEKYNAITSLQDNFNNLACYYWNNIVK